MKTPNLIFLYGPPAAGKTTQAKDFCSRNNSYVRISADEVRKELYGSEDVYGDSWTIYQIILKRMRKLLSEGKDVVYDATNLRKSYRMDYLNEIANIYCYKKIIIFSSEKEDCIKRHLARGRDIPLNSLLPLFDINEPPSFSEGWDEIANIISY